MKVVFTTLIMLYLALDFGDPHLPGAITFDLEDSVEVVQQPRLPSAPPPALAVTPTPLVRLVLPRPSPRPVIRPARDRLAPVRVHAVRRPPPDRSASEEG